MAGRTKSANGLPFSMSIGIPRPPVSSIAIAPPPAEIALNAATPMRAAHVTPGSDTVGRGTVAGTLLGLFAQATRMLDTCQAQGC